MRLSVFKTFYVFFMIVCTFFVCAFRWSNNGEKGALLFFSSNPIQRENIQNVGRHFGVGHRIYYMVVTPKGFRDDYVRVQIIKKEQKTNHWGYKLYWAKDIHIDSTMNDFMSYFVIDEPGYYFMQVFSFDDFDRVIVRNDFWVK